MFEKTFLEPLTGKGSPVYIMQASRETPRESDLKKVENFLLTGRETGCILTRLRETTPLFQTLRLGCAGAYYCHHANHNDLRKN